MAKDEPENPYVGYPSIHFPSDRLTIGTLRRMQPDLFDPKGPPPSPIDEEWNAAATQALQERGIPIPPQQQETDPFLEMLRALPGDASTIGDLRRQHPDLFDGEVQFIEAPQFETLYQLTDGLRDMLCTERALARMAYQEALGDPHDLPRGVIPEDREGYIEDLIEHYIRYRLASGEQEARRMIRKFTSAMAQTPKPQGRHEQRGR